MKRGGEFPPYAEHGRFSETMCKVRRLSVTDESFSVLIQCFRVDLYSSFFFFYLQIWAAALRVSGLQQVQLCPKPQVTEELQVI